MLKKLLTSVAALAMLAGASAQAAPSGAGLTPGAPVGGDDNGEKVVAGQRQ